MHSRGPSDDGPAELGAEQTVEPSRSETGSAAAGSLRQRTIRGIAWAAAEKWSVRLSTLVGFVLLGRLLQPAEFGVVSLAMVFITLLTVIADAGFATYLIQARELDRRLVNTAFYTALLFGALLTAALVAGSGPLADAFDSPDLALVLPAVSLAVLVAGFSSVPAALLVKELRFRDLAVRQASATLLSVVVAVVLAMAGAGVWALVAQHVTRSVVACVVLWVRSDFRPGLSYSLADAKVLTRFGGTAVLVQLGQQVRDQGESLLVGAVAGTTSLGYWTVARRFVGVVVDLFSSVVNVVAQPVFAKLRDDRSGLARAIGTSSAAGALLLTPVLVALALVSQRAVPVVFGDQWGPAAAIASVLALRSIVLSLGDFQRSALLGTGRPGAELAVTGVVLVGQAAIVLVAGRGDLADLAWWLTGWMALSWPLRALVLRRLLGVGWRTYSPTARVLLAAALAVVPVVVLGNLLDLDLLGSLAVGALGALCYLGALLLLCRDLVAEVVASIPFLRRRSRRAAGRAA